MPEASVTPAFWMLPVVNPGANDGPAARQRPGGAKPACASSAAETTAAARAAANSRPLGRSEVTLLSHESYPSELIRARERRWCLHHRDQTARRREIGRAHV